MRRFATDWGAGSLAVLLALVGTCWQAHAQEHHAEHTSLHERTQLFGDWRGARTRLAQRGIIVDLQSTHFYQGITSGGPPEHRGEWEYGGVGDAYITILGDKFGWKGFVFSIHAETRLGDTINPFVGLAPPNNRLLVPPDDPPVVAVTNYSFIQQIGRGWAVSAGKFNLVDLWDQIYHGGKGVDKFMNASLIIPLNFGRPISGLCIPGASILKMEGLEVQGTLAVLDTKDYCTKPGVEDLFDQGATIVGLWKFFHKLHGLPGYTSLLGIYNTREFDSISPSDIIFIPGQGLQFAEVTGTWALAGILNQKLWMDSANPKRNVELFAQLGIADDNPNPLNWIGTVGLTANGFIPGREHDGFGVGYFYTGLSDNFKQLLNTINLPLRDVQGVEVYYKFGLTPWLAVTADLQVVQPSNKAFDTAVIGGVRTNVTF